MWNVSPIFSHCWDQITDKKSLNGESSYLTYSCIQFFMVGKRWQQIEGTVVHRSGVQVVTLYPYSGSREWTRSVVMSQNLNAYFQHSTSFNVAPRSKDVLPSLPRQHHQLGPSEQTHEPMGNIFHSTHNVIHKEKGPCRTVLLHY